MSMEWWDQIVPVITVRFSGILLAKSYYSLQHCRKIIEKPILNIPFSSLLKQNRIFENREVCYYIIVIKSFIQKQSLKHHRRDRNSVVVHFFYLLRKKMSCVQYTGCISSVPVFRLQQLHHANFGQMYTVEVNFPVPHLRRSNMFPGSFWLRVRNIPSVGAIPKVTTLFCTKCTPDPSESTRGWPDCWSHGQFHTTSVLICSVQTTGLNLL